MNRIPSHEKDLLPAGTWNNTFPKAKESLKNAGHNAQEMYSNTLLLGRDVLWGIKKHAQKQEELVQVLEEKNQISYRKEILHDSKELFKYSGMFAWNLIKSGAYSLHGAIDYLDTAISKTGFLEKKGNRYLWNNIKTKIRQNFLKILIATTAIGGGAGYATYQAVHQGKIISEEKDALDEGIDGNEEEKFTYLHKSKDKRYNIYRYTLGEGMGISSVIEQATQEFPSYAPDRMLLTDSVGRAYPDTTFLFPEMSVYLKLPITLLKEKPLELWYEELYPDPGVKNITGVLPDKYSESGRILRCLRRENITEAVEERYYIPAGLLLAMMAQEGFWDVTVINQSNNVNKKSKEKDKRWIKTKGANEIVSDGGVGFLHIQTNNANEYGVRTIAPNSQGFRDFDAGELLMKAKSETKDNMELLIDYDDRFHPVIGMDLSARFLTDLCPTPSTQYPWDARITALKRYSGRGRADYVQPVLRYWTLISKQCGYPMPAFSDSNVNTFIKQIQDAKGPTRVETAIERFNTAGVMVGNKRVSYAEYVAYNRQQNKNYWLDAYKKLGTYK